MLQEWPPFSLSWKNRSVVKKSSSIKDIFSRDTVLMEVQKSFIHRPVDLTLSLWHALTHFEHHRKRLVTRTRAQSTNVNKAGIPHTLLPSPSNYRHAVELCFLIATILLNRYCCFKQEFLTEP